MQKPSQILNKIKSFSHGEYNNKNINEKNIEEKIINNEDIFGRGIKLKKINIDCSFPDYIVKNQDLLKDWIMV